MSLTFQRQIKAFTNETEAWMEQTLRTAVILMIEDAQRLQAQGGRMPFKTGRLVESLFVRVGGTRFTGMFAYLPASAAIKLGMTIFFGWTAHYAVHQEYGTRAFPAKFFARGATQRWKEFVARAAAMHK